MTLPQLCSTVTLYAYSGIYYGKGLSECLGDASPFIESFNLLVTRTLQLWCVHVGFCGEVKEYELAECCRAGRVPTGP